MLHCHMMNHEELGMMQVVEVYAASVPISLNAIRYQSVGD